MAELLVVMAIGLTVSSAAVLPFQAIATSLRADANVRILEGQLQFARDAAGTQRRNFEIRITNGDHIEVVRHDRPSGTTVVSRIRLAHGARFMVADGTPDTPDGFGRLTPVYFGVATTVQFTPDGMVTDASGHPVNGTISLAIPGQSTSARAVTVFGVSARTRSYRWDGHQWRQ